MQTEFEVKILDIDVDKIISKLESIGAEKIKEKEQKRYVYDFTPVKKDSWVRLRTDGEKTTVTVKEIHSDEIDGTKEVSVIVDNFEQAHKLLEKLGYKHKAYQENKRISYLLDGVKIEIDFWPRIPVYIEVEGKSPEEVEEIVKLVGFEMDQTTSMSVKDVYAKYGIDIEIIKELKF